MREWKNSEPRVVCDLHNRVNRRLDKPLMNCAEAQRERKRGPSV